MCNRLRQLSMVKEGEDSMTSASSADATPLPGPRSLAAGSNATPGGTPGGNATPGGTPGGDIAASPGAEEEVLRFRAALEAASHSNVQVSGWGGRARGAAVEGCIVY